MMNTHKLLLTLFITSTNIYFILCTSLNENLMKKEPDSLSPCKACKVFAKSFLEQMEKTKKGKFEGGDTAWEEEKLGSYATSEIRLTEIQENVCSEVKKGKDQCYAIHEEFDSEIEEWWFNKQQESSDFYKYFCIDTIKYCCADKHYGLNCTACDGYPGNICSGNGKCEGAGTRTGSGKCICNKGFTGKSCADCADNYYASYDENNKLSCSPCHISCHGRCTKDGPKGCSECKSGWSMSENEGCLDIDECSIKPLPCTKSQYCVNTEGSFQCLKCDKSCEDCTGKGSDHCTECANGYTLYDNNCIEIEAALRARHITVSKYVIFAITSIVQYKLFKKNIYLAALAAILIAAIYFTSNSLPYFSSIET